MPQEFDVVCLGGGVAGEAIAVGLKDSGLTLAVVERELVGGECPYLGLRALEDPASFGRDTDRGRARSCPGRLTDGVGRRLSQSLQARAVDGTRPRRHPARRGDDSDWREAFPRRRDADGSAHRRGWKRSARRAPRGGDRQRQHRGDSVDPRPGYRRVLDQPPGRDSKRAAGLAGDPRRRRDWRRAGTGLRPAWVEGHDHRSRTKVSRDSKSRRPAPRSGHISSRTASR